MSTVYLFRENSLVIPDSMKDHEASGGVDRDAADRAFGNPEYCSILPVGLTGEPILASLFNGDVPIPAGWRLLAVRNLLSSLVSVNVSQNHAGRLLRAFHVLQWRNESVFCGSCGEKNGDSPDELARLCPRCGRIEYPRIAPAVIVLIIDKSDRILLAHNNKFKYNMYSLIAGFVEAGESLEGAACREIKEELAVDVKDIRYIKSQGWPFPNSLMVGFTACFAGGEIKPDGNEIEDARWFDRDTIKKSAERKPSAENQTNENCFVPDLPGPGSISRYIIDIWLKGIYTYINTEGL